MNSRGRLTTRERTVLELLTRYYQATGETCSVLYLARRLKLHHKTVQAHLDSLTAKGWIATPSGDGKRPVPGLIPIPPKIAGAQPLGALATIWASAWRPTTTRRLN